VKLQLGLFLTLTGVSLGLGFLIRDRLNTTPRAQIVMTGDTLELPFEDYGGHLYVQGKINGTPTKDLVIDSGAADWFVSASKAKALGLQPQGNSTSEISMQLGTLMGALTLQDHATAILPQAEVEGLEQYFGRPVSGILGYELFEQLVVEVDYQHQTLGLHRPQTYRYQGKGQRIPLEMEGDRPYIQATVTPYGYPTFSGKLMVDLGSNAALSLTAGCGLDQQLIAAAPRTLKRNLATITGANQIILGRVQRVQIGSLQIQQPITIFGKTTGEDCDRLSGKIGYQILRQFKVILDYPHRQLILEPILGANPVQQPSYDYDLSGLWLEATGAQLKNYRVGAISANTPAARAGVQVGDTLVKLNNIATSNLTLVQVRRQLSQTGQTLILLIQRKTNRITVRLKLQPLL
jgi:PDZ domain/Aspartyl protease